jgi:hypothetical protein
MPVDPPTAPSAVPRPSSRVDLGVQATEVRRHHDVPLPQRAFGEDLPGETADELRLAAPAEQPQTPDMRQFIRLARLAPEPFRHRVGMRRLMRLVMGVRAANPPQTPSQSVATGEAHYGRDIS